MAGGLASQANPRAAALRRDWCVLGLVVLGQEIAAEVAVAAGVRRRRAPSAAKQQSHAQKGGLRAA